MTISATDDLAGIEIRHLVALCAVVEEGSFGAAATRLGYTQSAVSQQIASFERVVGAPLFDRPGGPRKVRLTRAGELMHQHAVVILARVAAARADLSAFAEGDAGTINIGTFQSIAVRTLPRIVGRLRERAPGLRIELTEQDETRVLAEALVAGDLEVSFLLEVAAHGLPIDVVGTWTDQFLVMSPVHETLAPAGEPVPVGLLGAPPMVGQRANSCQALLERHLAAVGVQPDFTFRTGDNSAVQAMVRAGGCHAVTPRLTIDLDDPGISVHTIDPPLPDRRIVLAVPSGRPRTPAVERFIEIATRVCEELLDPATP